MIRLRSLLAAWVLWFTAAPAVAQEQKPAESMPEEMKLAEQAHKLIQEGMQLYQRGQPADAVDRLEKGIALVRRIYTQEKYPDGHSDLANLLNNLGVMLHAQGNLARAKANFEESLAMRRKLYPASKYSDGHPDQATSMINLGAALQASGDFAGALPHVEAALAMRRKLFPPSRYPKGHADVASGLMILASLHRARGAVDQALPFGEEGLAMTRRLFPESDYPNGHPLLAQTINSMGSLWKAKSTFEKALPLYEESLAIYRRLYPDSKYPDGHPLLAQSINNLGVLLSAHGGYERARDYYEQSLAMTRKLYPESKYPNGHPDLATGIDNLALLLRDQGALDEALPYCEQALAMKRKLFPETRFPNGHPALANSHNNLGVVLRDVGAFEKALPHLEQALAICRKLYSESRFPNGHPELAQSLNNLGGLLRSLGKFDQAMTYYEQGLTMRRKLYPESKYPNGHAEIAASLTNIGILLRAQDKLDEARPYYEQALAMSRRLFPASTYPDGHTELAQSVSNLAFQLRSQGKLAEALPLAEEALTMKRKLYPVSKYPDGHRDLATSLTNMGDLLELLGKAEQSLVLYEQAFSMFRALGQRMMLTASEADVLSFMEAQPLTRDALLSATAPRTDSAAAAYRWVWDSKAAVFRVLELRHAATRAAGSAAAERLSHLKEVRRRIDQLLRETRGQPRDRDRELTRLADERDDLERQIAQELPVFAQWQQRNRLGPEDLTKALPADAVFVDLAAYTNMSHGLAPDGTPKRERIPRYAAFILAPGRAIQRVELGPAEPINSAIQRWRRAIDERRDVDAAEQLQHLLWAPIAKHLPGTIKTLYISSDSDLARLPWAALPTGRDRVLLEDYAIATVEHGPFLLEQLKSARTYDGAGSVLAVGGIDYGKSWPALAGTASEVAALSALAPTMTTILSKSDATAENLSRRLPTARYVHLATHGQFRAEELAAEKLSEQNKLVNWREGLSDASRAVAAKNPLGFVGLVLTNGQIMSGLSILGLNLDHVKLLTLSACETGLGEYTGGEGVQGLQRAFHLAGCPNVVASLWKVNDAATAALMAKFYHEMWVNRKPPIEALREAQLTIYRRPDLIPALAAERGLKLEEALNAKSAPPAEAKGTTPTKLWAAFVLSGVGK